MINENMFAWGEEPSAIRELFAYGMARKAEIGDDKVFDYSIGNPSVPAPDKVRESILDFAQGDPVELHAYTPAAGDPAVKQVIADHIHEKFGVKADPAQIYLTAGAAAGIAITLAALTNPGDEVIVIAPYFPEYAVWVRERGCTCVEVPAAVPSFQIDVEAVERAITPQTSAIIINTPNNPTGAVYTRDNLEKLAAMLVHKEAEFGHSIYLISDEPYREITYGKEVPYIPVIYAHTIVCYSYSKSLSLPGERIGYIYVSDLMDEAHDVSVAIAGAGRALGYVCAPSLLQRVIARCIDEPSDVEAYAVNRELLTKALGEIGYEFVEPEGAFYLWVRALEDDAQAFSDHAKDFELLLVPSNSFGTSGWVRLSYCIARDVIERSIPAFTALMESYR